MVEALLEQQASQSFLLIKPATLRFFSETYGKSAFVCRYLHCVRATQGFDSSQQRNNHEATHERKFRCAETSCASFSLGFATKIALKRHNEKYHAAFNSQGSLLVTIEKARLLPEIFGSKNNDGKASPSKSGSDNMPLLQSSCSDVNKFPSRDHNIPDGSAFVMPQPFLAADSIQSENLQKSRFGNASRHSMQIQAIIFKILDTQTGPLTGWQAGVLPNERIGLIFNM
jgi:hypothetical protein